MPIFHFGHSQIISHCLNWCQFGINATKHSFQTCCVARERREVYSCGALTQILQGRSPGFPGSVCGTQYLGVLLPCPSNCSLQDRRNTRLLGKLLFLSVAIDIVSVLWKIDTSDCKNLSPEQGVHKWDISL